MLIHGIEKNFEEQINKEYILVDFYADWCGPCKMLSPILEELSNDIDVIKINVDECESLAKQYGIMSIPTLILFKNGEIISKKNGFMQKQELELWIKENQ